jgi:hypothetical protein
MVVQAQDVLILFGGGKTDRRILAGLGDWWCSVAIARRWIKAWSVMGNKQKNTSRPAEFQQSRISDGTSDERSRHDSAKVQRRRQPSEDSENHDPRNRLLKNEVLFSKNAIPAMSYPYSPKTNRW